MAFFANGSEGDMFQARWCDKCVNWRDDGNGEGCAIWDIHLLWNYEQQADETKRLALDMLIQGDGMNGWTCRMYNDGAQSTPAQQQAAQRERQRVEQHPWVAARQQQ